MPGQPAVVVHGAGSSPGVATTAFPGAASFWLAGHGPAEVVDDDGATDRAALAALVAELRAEVVAGISYGAHQVARWAAGGLPDHVARIALVMPAWTGGPDATAAATHAQAEEFATHGVRPSLDRILADHPGWIADALAASWPLHDRGRIVAALRAVAASTAPVEADLRRIAVPTTVVALAHDPLHPEAVARRWADAIPGARLVIVDARSLGDLGVAALTS